MSSAPTGRESVSAPDYLLAGVSMALAFAVQLPFVAHQAVLLDEGVILQMAVDIANGKAPYRDGVHYAFPGVFYLTAAVFEVFGPSLEAARILAAALFATTAGVSILICRWWCTRPEAIFFFLVLLSYRVWSFPHWHMLNYSPLAVTMALAAAWAAGEHIVRTGYRWAFVAGVFCGLAVLGKQDSGGATAIALGIAMLALRPATWRDRLNGAVAFSAATSLVVLGCLLAVWQAGYLEDLIREAIYGPLYGAANYQYLGRPALFPLFAQDAHLRENHFSYLPQVLMEPYGLRLLGSAIYRNTGIVDAGTKIIYHAPWMIAVVAAIYLSRRALQDIQSPGLRRRLLVLLIAVAFLLAFNRPHDWIHLLVLYPPTLFLLVSAVPWLRHRSLARALAAAACIALFAVSAHLALEFRKLHSEPVTTRRGTFYTRPALAAGFRNVLDAIERTPPDRPLLAYPYHPFLNFLADRPGATRYLFLWPVEWNDKRDDEIIAVLEERPDTTVLYSLSQLVHLGSPRDFATKLYRYLADNYEIEPDLRDRDPRPLVPATAPRARSPRGVAAANDSGNVDHYQTSPQRRGHPAREGARALPANCRLAVSADREPQDAAGGGGRAADSHHTKPRRSALDQLRDQSRALGVSLLAAGALPPRHRHRGRRRANPDRTRGRTREQPGPEEMVRCRARPQPLGRPIGRAGTRRLHALGHQAEFRSRRLGNT